MLDLENLSIDIRFWATVFVASALKWLFTPEEKEQTRKQSAAGIVAGGVCAFYGTDLLLAQFQIAETSRDVVVIGLVFTGEHIVRTLFNFGPLFARKLLGVTNEDVQAQKGDSSDS